MHITLLIDEVPFDVLLSRVEDDVEVTVDGDEYSLRAERALDDLRVRHAHDDDAHLVTSPLVGVLVIDGEEHRVEVRDYRPGGKAGPAALGGNVVTPMPGKIVRVDYQDGAVVAAGDVVLVLEAMKMQVEVKAPDAGTIRHLEHTVGQTVDAQARLFVLEAAEGLSASETQ